jgi:hypothetical protein
MFSNSDRILSQINSNIYISDSTISGLVAPCEGAVFQWDLGSPYQTYPFVIHDPVSRFKPRFSLLFVNHHESSIRVRSHRCTGKRLNTYIGPCNACQSAGEDIEIVKSHAQKSSARLDHTVMSNKHFREKLEAIERSLKNEKLKVCILVVS